MAKIRTSRSNIADFEDNITELWDTIEEVYKTSAMDSIEHHLASEFSEFVEIFHESNYDDVGDYDDDIKAAYNAVMDGTIKTLKDAMDWSLKRFSYK